MIRKRFVAAREARPGAAWHARFSAGRAEAEAWYRGQGRAPPAAAADCRAALRAHMPELRALYDAACARVGDNPLAHAILSHWRPPPAAHGCTQAVWHGPDGPALVRNYDFAPATVTGRFESSAWFGREVIAAAQRPWGGCLDGMNADGLVASLTAGGTSAMGEGFAVTLMLRYVLETCATVDAAARTLARIPIAQAQNVTLLDRTGASATVFLGPGRPPAISRAPVCANHQDDPALPATFSRARAAAAQAALDDPAMTLPALTQRFLQPPLHVRGTVAPTVYTAVYRPAQGRVAYLWPGKLWRQSLGGFRPGVYEHLYADA